VPVGQTTSLLLSGRPMDIGTTTGIHVGSRYINRRSIGVEIVNAGVPGRLDSRRRPQESRVINGNTKTVLQYYPGQIRTWQRLALLLTTTPAEAQCGPSFNVANALHDAGIVIPRSVPFIEGQMLNQKMNTKASIRLLRSNGASSYVQHT